MRRFSFALVLMALSVVSTAAEIGSGSYRCASYNVSGGGGSCRTMQPLVLRANGTYQHSSTQGRWSAQGGRLHLSESTLWGTGEILGRDTIRFEYDYRGWRHTVTWICQECGYGEAPRPSTPAAAPQGGYVGVSLTLEFGTRIGGVSGFVIIPAESARSYTHNAPLPEGAVQGLARESGATSVALATNRENKLRSGRQYVVFLAWPRETIPVALLDLPPGNADYSATLPASLRQGVPTPGAGAPGLAGRSAQEQSSFGSALEDFAKALRDLGAALEGDGNRETAPPQPTLTNVVPPRYQIGVQIMPINEEIARNLGQPELRGIGVARVVEGGRAERAGLRAGDVMTHVNHVPVPSVEDYQRAIRHREGGEPSRLTVFREGKLRYVDVP